VGVVVMTPAERNQVLSDIITASTDVDDVVGVFAVRATSENPRPAEADHAHSITGVYYIPDGFFASNALGLWYHWV
jgi:hypothetical protein